MFDLLALLTGISVRGNAPHQKLRVCLTEFLTALPMPVGGAIFLFNIIKLTVFLKPHT